jgi:transcriptional regulator with XRE-family HTH domain
LSARFLDDFAKKKEKTLSELRSTARKVVMLLIRRHATQRSNLVKPRLLVWARESAGFSTLAQVAHKTKVSEDDLKAWESGEKLPSVAQLRKLGKVYKRPIAVFFLSEPPRGFSPQREFRRLPRLLPGESSPELLLALR